MNKKEMVKEILDKGMLISPELLDILNEDTLKAIINGAKTPGQNKLVVESVPKSLPPETESTKPISSKQPEKKAEQQQPVKSTDKEQPAKLVRGERHEQQQPITEAQQVVITPDFISAGQTNTISIKASSPKKTETLSPGDFVKYYNNKYNTLREMLLKKTNAVSINKLDGHSTTTVIGMVKELTPKGFVIEDPTGQAEAIVNQDIKTSMGIAEDDVLSVTGNARDGAIFVKDLTLPDVPLTHPVGSLEATILLSEKETPTMKTTTQNPGPNAPEADIVCTPGSIKAVGKPNGSPNTTNTSNTNSPANPINTEVTVLANPAWVDVSKGEKTIKLLIYRPENEATMEYAISLLKKRHLSPKRGTVRSIGDHDPYLIETVPDIFWIVTKEKGFKAYKGVTVISCGPGASACVDMGTRKVEFL